MKRLLLVLLLGCQQPVSKDPIFQATETAWKKQGLPVEKKSACMNRSSYSTAGNAVEFEKYCLAPPSKAAACLLYRDNYWVAFLAPDQEVSKEGEPVVHEALHALHFCYIDNSADRYDYNHRNPNIWIEAGGNNTAQRKAEQLVLESRD